MSFAQHIPEELAKLPPWARYCHSIRRGYRLLHLAQLVPGWRPGLTVTLEPLLRAHRQHLFSRPQLQARPTMQMLPELPADGAVGSQQANGALGALHQVVGALFMIATRAVEGSDGQHVKDLDALARRLAGGDPRTAVPSTIGRKSEADLAVSDLLALITTCNHTRPGQTPHLLDAVHEPLLPPLWPDGQPTAEWWSSDAKVYLGTMIRLPLRIGEPIRNPETHRAEWKPNHGYAAQASPEQDDPSGPDAADHANLKSMDGVTAVEDVPPGVEQHDSGDEDGELVIDVVLPDDVSEEEAIEIMKKLALEASRESVRRGGLPLRVRSAGVWTPIESEVPVE